MRHFRNAQSDFFLKDKLKNDFFLIVALLKRNNYKFRNETKNNLIGSSLIISFQIS